MHAHVILIDELTVAFNLSACATIVCTVFLIIVTIAILVDTML